MFKLVREQQFHCGPEKCCPAFFFVWCHLCPAFLFFTLIGPAFFYQFILTLFTKNVILLFFCLFFCLFFFFNLNSYVACFSYFILKMKLKWQLSKKKANRQSKQANPCGKNRKNVLQTNNNIQTKTQKNKFTAVRAQPLFA